MTTSISLAEASERLGVHYMTAYRYVRTGRLHAEKQGGQWQVALDDLAAFEGGDADEPAPRSELIPKLLIERLLAGDENGATQLLESSMASGATAEEVYIDFLTPCMTEVGRRWHDGEITIADEHIATSTAFRVVSRIGSRMSPRGRTRGTIVLAVVAEDYHGMPTALLRDILRSRGFEVIDLGANTPSESILLRAQATNDLVAVGLCCSKLDNDDIIRETLSTLNDALDVPIVMGGSAFSGHDHIHSFGVCSASSSTRHAIDLFEEIHTQRIAS